jgi:hypothetical protein
MPSAGAYTPVLVLSAKPPCNKSFDCIYPWSVCAGGLGVGLEHLVCLADMLSAPQVAAAASTVAAAAAIAARGVQHAALQCADAVLSSSCCLLP